MSENESPASQEQAPPQVQQPLSLEDLDKLLDEEDPSFNEQLEEVRAVESDANVVIESSAVLDDDAGDFIQPEDLSGFAKIRFWIVNAFYLAQARLTIALYYVGKSLYHFIRTKP